MKKKALITGITGQDGSYLAEFLLKKGYVVHGIKRKSSTFNTSRIDHIYKDFHEASNFFLHYGDLADSNSLVNIVNKIKPNEIYNLGAQSHVGHSFEIPEYTSEVTGLGTLRLLEAMRFLNLSKTKFYQASTSELFGEKLKGINSFNEKSLMVPKSPYGVSKLYSYWITKVYRQAYGFYARNGILFNHESPRRGETFVTRKITRFLAKKKLGSKDILYLGNLNAKRDWGSADDYVKTMWMMMQKKIPSDYVIATGISKSVRDFVEESFKCIGINIIWQGKGTNEIGINKKTKEVLVKIDKYYFRPTEVHELRGDSRKARKQLGWKPKITFKELVKSMVEKDILKIQSSNS